MNTDRNKGKREKFASGAGLSIGLFLFAVSHDIHNKIFVEVSAVFSVVVVLLLIVAVRVQKLKKARQISQPGDI